VTVLVVGAGPVGLMLAGELAQGGIRPTVVDRLDAPMTDSRASQLNTRTVEILNDRGLSALVAEAVRELVGHFAGLRLNLSEVDSPYAGNWKVAQHRTESALAERAAGLGVEVLRGRELCGLEVHEDFVLCDVSGEEVRADHVVGCDGAASTVRRLAGFEFVGAAATKELLRADVTGLDVRDRRFERLDRGLAVAATRDGVTRVMVHAFGHPASRRASAPEFAEFAATWAEVTGEDISGGTAIWVDAFDNQYGQVTDYRRGRVLLAGDAAHWHMPIGGQALNLGLQDAADLGTKLAARTRDRAADSVLDSYHEERHAAGARVLRHVRAQELLLLGGSEVAPLRALLGELLTIDPVHRLMAELASGIPVSVGREDDGVHLTG
jgi:2-polyprenyl-6-methoxyphenol hydroxylase-like FAD-dependent oxidoreductase